MLERGWLDLALLFTPPAEELDTYMYTHVVAFVFLCQLDRLWLCIGCLVVQCSGDHKLSAATNKANDRK